MKRLLLWSVTAMLLLVLTAPATLGAPRVSSGTATDWHVNIAPSGLGIVYDLNQSSGKERNSRFTVEGAFFFKDTFNIGLSAAYVYPINPKDQLKMAFFAGPQIGVGNWYSYAPGLYLGIVAGLAFETDINHDWKLTGEFTYAPAVGFYPGWTGYVYHGGYGLYLLYDVRSDLTINLGVRSMGWIPGFFMGISY